MRSSRKNGEVAFAVGIVLTLSVFAAIQNANAQQWPSQMWHDGKVVLVEGDTIKGQIKYDLQQDLIQINIRNTRTEAFSARKVLFFEIFDMTVRRYRQFYALPFNNTTGYKTPVFFELLVEGKFTLLAREAIEFRSYSSPYYLGSYTRQILVNHFFFLNEDGDISEFKGSKGDLLDMMGKKSDAVEAYMKENHLKPDDKYEFARIVAYYNSI
ncbi:MAG: hypothetical protein ABJA70_11595 [Chryseolinea sp.]